MLKREFDRSQISRVRVLLRETYGKISEEFAVRVVDAVLRWKPMASAPRDGREIIICVRHSVTNEEISLVACWMAYDGDPTKQGWYGACPATGTKSFDGLPHHYTGVKIAKPIKWMHLPIRRPRRAHVSTPRQYTQE